MGTVIPSEIPLQQIQKRFRKRFVRFYPVWPLLFRWDTVPIWCNFVHSRKVLSWRLSNTMDTDFCINALEEALAKYGRPDIFNTDQGRQFISFAFTNVFREDGIRISMDGRGRWLDNVFIEASAVL